MENPFSTEERERERVMSEFTDKLRNASNYDYFIRIKDQFLEIGGVELPSDITDLEKELAERKIRGLEFGINFSEGGSGPRHPEAVREAKAKVKELRERYQI